MPRKKKDIYPDIRNEFAEFETEEEKKEKKKQKKADEDDMDCLPQEGLYTPDGHLFYHENPYQLTLPQYKRAADHGINLRKKIGFSIEESVQMFKNWKKFAEDNKIKLTKAEEYVGAKKAQKHLLQHQEEFKFWPKLCDGLPHRAGYHVKQRAEFMLTEDFLNTLDWSNLDEEIRMKFYVYTDYSEEQMQKAKRLLDRGYVAGHVGELLGVSKQIACGMQKKLNAINERDDPQMVQQFFDAAVTFGLDFDKLREYLESSDDVSYHYLDKTIQINEMSLKIHMSTDRILEFLRIWLDKIWKRYQEKKENDKRTADEKYEEAMQVISSKPPLSADQILRGLEIFCQNIKRDEKSIDLQGRKDIAKLLKKAGITGFMCHMPEYQYLYQKFCSHMPQVLEKWLFRHLRRSFRFQLKLHIVMWTWKTSEWNKLKIGPGETRYEAVIRHEMANPYVSEITLKFLKDPDVAEWIMEPRLTGDGRHGAIRRRVLGIELFVLYCNQKYGSRFLFPVKLRPLLSKSAKQIRKILEKNEKDSEGRVADKDSEYVSVREVREVVEKATNSKMVTGVSKWVMQKEQIDSDGDSEDVEDSDDARGDSEDVEGMKRILKHVKAKENNWAEQREAEIQEILAKADPTKRKKGFTDSADSDDESGDVELTEKVRRERQALRRVEEKWKKRNERKEFKSRAFLDSSEDSEDSGDGAQDSDGQEDSRDVAEDSEGLEASGDVIQDPESPRVKKKAKKSKKRTQDSGDVAEDSEDLEASGDVAQDSEGQEDSEVCDIKKKKKKAKKRTLGSQDSGVPEDSEGLEDSGDYVAEDSGDLGDLGDQDSEGQEDFEVVDVRKKAKKSKKRKLDFQDSGVPENSEGLEDSGDYVAEDSGDLGDLGDQDSEGQEDFEVVDVRKKAKKSKKRKLDFQDSGVPENSEGLEASGDVAGDSGDLGDLGDQDSEGQEDFEVVDVRKKAKKSKKRKLDFQDSGVPENSEGLEASGDVAGDSGDLGDRGVQDSEGVEDSEVVDVKKKKKKQKKKMKMLDSQDSEVPEDSGDVAENSGDLGDLGAQDSEVQMDSESPRTKKKAGKSKKRDSGAFVDSQDVHKAKKRKIRDPEDFVDVEKLKKSKKRDSEAILKHIVDSEGKKKKKKK